MPPSPEFRYRSRNIGIIKVFKELKAEHSSQTYCHITVTTRIKKDLKCICYSSKPAKCCRYTVTSLISVKSLISQYRKIICKQDFFRKTDNKTRKPIREIFYCLFSGSKQQRYVRENRFRQFLSANAATHRSCPAALCVLHPCNIWRLQARWE